MKKIFLIISALILAIVSGCQTYELNTDFTMPQELVSPESVALDVTSSDNVILSWNGGGAADGGILLYNVYFDKEGGDFSEPISVMQSDLGAKNTLTLTHSQLNVIARKSGIKPKESGKLIWTVSASKGGITKRFDGSASLGVTRGEGIDNIPEHLYVNGTAAKEAGQEFRVAEEGLYIIYTKLGAGSLKFNSEKDGGFTFYADATGKLNEGEGEHTISEAPATGLARITVDFNTLSFSVEEIETEVRAIWAANYADIAVLEYTSNGQFVGDGDVIFLGPGREGTPDWCSWVEERYYFIAKVEGKEVCWGSTFGDGAWTPDGTKEFFYVVENPWEQWKNLWKMDHQYDMCHVTFTIDTNKDNQMTHSYAGGAIQYDQPTKTPAKLFLNGKAAEADGQEMMKDGDKFIIYNKLKEGNISFTDENGTKYFANAENDLFIGSPKTAVKASEGVSRIIIDFATKKMSIDAIDSKIYLKWAALYNKPESIAELSYQGLGKYAGEGEIIFLCPGRPTTPDFISWDEERYYFVVNINGEDKCWGRLDSVSGENRPDDPSALVPEYWNLGEFTLSQWDHCWKMPSNLDESKATVTINTNDMTHAFQKATSDPVKPTVAPENLTLKGTGAEAETPFRKVGDGLFEVITKLKDGQICFTSGSKNYFADASGVLLQGDGNTTSTVGTGLAEKIVVDFVNCTVSVKPITKLIAIWGCNEQEFMNFSYVGNGAFKATGHIKFIDPGDPQYGMATWLTWTEERYRYIATIDGEDKCWGRLNSVNENDKPNTPDAVKPEFWQIGEFPRGGQWDHLWKFGDNMENSDAEIVINTNDNGVMTQTITKK